MIWNSAKSCSSFWKNNSSNVTCSIWVANTTETSIRMYGHHIHLEAQASKNFIMSSHRIVLSIYVLKHILFYYKLLDLYCSSTLQLGVYIYFIVHVSRLYYIWISFHGNNYKTYAKRDAFGSNSVENLCFTDYLIQLLHFMKVKLEAEWRRRVFWWQVQGVSMRGHSLPFLS